MKNCCWVRGSATTPPSTTCPSSPAPQPTNSPFPPSQSHPWVSTIASSVSAHTFVGIFYSVLLGEPPYCFFSGRQAILYLSFWQFTASRNRSAHSFGKFLQGDVKSLLILPESRQSTICSISKLKRCASTVPNSDTKPRYLPLCFLCSATALKQGTSTMKNID
jgi:hypothetical protein